MYYFYAAADLTLATISREVMYFKLVVINNIINYFTIINNLREELVCPRRTELTS